MLAANADSASYRRREDSAVGDLVEVLRGVDLPARRVGRGRPGIDLVLVPDPAEAEAVYTAVLRAVKQGRIPRARVRDAAARVLALKSSLR